jgi:hypothetical protein
MMKKRTTGLRKFMQRAKAKKIVKVEDLVAGEKMDPNAVVVYSVRIPAPLYERLRKLNFDTRRPVSEYVVRGVEMVLKAEKY